MTNLSWKHLPLLFVLSFGFLAGCQDSPEERLLGYWKSLDEIPKPGQGGEDQARSGLRLELAFFDDETCTFRINNPLPIGGRIPTMSCDWALSGGNLLKLEVRMPDGDMLVETFTVRFDGDQLELEESNGHSRTFEQVPGSD